MTRRGRGQKRDLRKHRGDAETRSESRCPPQDEPCPRALAARAPVLESTASPGPGPAREPAVRRARADAATQPRTLYRNPAQRPQEKRLERGRACGVPVGRTARGVAAWESGHPGRDGGVGWRKGGAPRAPELGARCAHIFSRPPPQPTSQFYPRSVLLPESASRNDHRTRSRAPT